jgi:hypothetical protein
MNLGVSVMKTFDADSAAVHTFNRPRLNGQVFFADLLTAFINFFMLAFKNARYAIRLSLMGLLTLAVLGLPLIAIADSSAPKLLVSASIQKHASLQVLAQPASVQVTAADVARGYVDVSSPAQVAIQSNAPSGYVLSFETQGEFLSQTLVKGLDTVVQLSASGGGVTQRATGHGMSKKVIALEFRFLLSETARQGLYAWPVRLSVTPI